ncbi:MAG: putative plasmid stabilization protein [Rhizobiaceae bacterium]|jgi:plasmid stability protein|nr:putative plasmid stabilization protein [Rhizobiaceae bacterium]
MPAITVRNLSIETHRALKIRAAQHGRSTEAEIRDILEKAARPESRIKLGSLLAEIGREVSLTGKERAAFEAALERDRAPVEPVRFD